MTGDDELFEELQRLVSPPLREPPLESVAALHTSVARQFGRSTRGWWWRRRAAVAAAVVGMVAGAPAAAFAISGTPLPDPLRTAMHTLGLPVDSVRVADTKSAEADLEHALHTRDQTEISNAAVHLQTCLAELDGGERARLAPHADALLRAATADMADGQERLGRAPSAHSLGHGPGPGGGPSISSGPTDGEGKGDPTGGTSGGSGDGDGPIQSAPRPVPTTSGAVTPVSGRDDGDQSATTATTTSSQGRSDDGSTTTTLQTGGDDRGSGSGSPDGSSGDAPTTTATDQSH